jgi:hypothetical protein
VWCHIGLNLVPGRQYSTLLQYVCMCGGVRYRRSVCVPAGCTLYNCSACVHVCVCVCVGTRQAVPYTTAVCVCMCVCVGTRQAVPYTTAVRVCMCACVCV